MSSDSSHTSAPVNTPLAEHRSCLVEYDHYTHKVKTIREKKDIAGEKVAANVHKLQFSQNALEDIGTTLVRRTLELRPFDGKDLVLPSQHARSTQREGERAAS